MEKLGQWLSKDELQFVRSQLARFGSGTDQGQLAGIANAPEMFALEKRVVPYLNKGRIPTPDTDVLVCTVGLRCNPVILTALILKPRRLYLLHSADSREQAEKIRDDPDVQALGLAPNRDTLLREISLTDAPRNYDQLRIIVQENEDKRIAIDVSGGVKVMGVSLAAAAFWQRLPVIYLLGDEVKGIIRPFSEQLMLLQNPHAYFGDTGFRVLKEQFDAGDYDAALSTCRALRDTVGDVATLGQLDVLEELIAIYRDWDAFQHSTLQDDPIRRLAARLRAVTLKMVRLGLRLIEGQALAGNQAFLDELEGSWQEDRRSQSDVHRLVDVYCAAERRARAAKYDDAIARLYRCLEMSGTILLLRDWQFTSIQRPDYGALASALGGEAALRDAFQRRARYPLPEKLGLDAQMTLLAVGGKHGAVAGIYAGMKKGTHGLMEGRNRSILAHGTVPVSEAVYRRFSLKTADVISRVAGKECLARLVEQATHPTILL